MDGDEKPEKIVTGYRVAVPAKLICRKTSDRSGVYTVEVVAVLVETGENN